MYAAVQDSTLRVFGFPREYVQGPNALAELPRLIRRHGYDRAFVVADPMVMGRVRKVCEGSDIAFFPFGGECTEKEAEAIAADCDGQKLIVGVGGGKCLDTAKMVSIIRDAAFFSVPTIASNDAPTSRLVVLYDDSHRIVGNRFMRTNADVVLVDTDIIAAAPVRFLRAGIGDALTKFFEARAVFNAGGQNFLSGSPPFLATIMGSACLDAVLAEGAACLAALAEGNRPDGLERLVEATILLSGLAFESGGLSIAHSMARGLTRIPKIAGALHGEQVVYGLLVQLMLEDDAPTLRRITDFNRQVGLPTSLADFGLHPHEMEMAKAVIAEGTLTAPYLKNFSRELGAADLVAAMADLEALFDSRGQDRAQA